MFGSKMAFSSCKGTKQMNAQLISRCGNLYSIIAYKVATENVLWINLCGEYITILPAYVNIAHDDVIHQSTIYWYKNDPVLHYIGGGDKCP